MKSVQMRVLLAVAAIAMATGGCVSHEERSARYEARLRQIYDTRIPYYQSKGFTYQQSVLMVANEIELMTLRGEVALARSDARRARYFASEASRESSRSRYDGDFHSSYQPPVSYRAEDRGGGNYRLTPTGYNPGLYRPIDVRVR